MSDHDDLESTALFIHGMAAACNLIGVIYNLRRHKWFPFWGNLCGFIFHLGCAWFHLKDVKGEKK